MLFHPAENCMFWKKIKKNKHIHFVFASDAAKPLETHTEILLQVFNHKNFFHHCVHVNPDARLFALQ